MLVVCRLQATGFSAGLVACNMQTVGSHNEITLNCFYNPTPYMDNLEKENETPAKDNSLELDEITKERYKQQMEWSIKEVEKRKNLAKQVAKVSNKPELLHDLYKEDKELANQVSQEVFGKEYKEMQSEEPKNSPEADFEKWYEQRKAKEQHEQAIEFANWVFSKISNEEKRNEAMEYFAKLVKWKQLTQQEAKEIAEMSALYVNKDQIKSDKLNSWFASMASSSISWSKPVQEKDDVIVYRWKLVSLSSLQQNG